MRHRWSIILPIYGLTLFTFISYGSFRMSKERPILRSGHFFYWGAVRLNSDPLNKHVQPPKPKACPEGQTGCMEWDPETIWIEPGVPQKILILSAIPAFLVEIAFLNAAAKLGISQIPVFFISMPISIFAWFYFIGWLFDRRRYKRTLKSAPAS